MAYWAVTTENDTYTIYGPGDMLAGMADDIDETTAQRWCELLAAREDEILAALAANEALDVRPTASAADAIYDEIEAAARAEADPLADLKAAAIAAYDNATGMWDSCDWDPGLDDDEARAAYEAQATADAAEAERLAAEALAHIEAGNYEAAARAADEADGLEWLYGASPTWGPFAVACEALRLGERGEGAFDRLVTKTNIETACEECSATDQADQLVPGCETWLIPYQPGNQYGQMSRWPDGRGAVAFGGDSAWGDWDDRGILITDEGAGFNERGEWIYDGPIDTLGALLEAMQGDDPRVRGRWDDLPTFGGRDIEDTTGVWSWDAERMLVGSCATELEIVSRRERLALLTVDEENSAETWWDAARAADDQPLAFRRLDLDATWSIEIAPAEARRFLRWAERLPGWDTGPAFAPCAVLVDLP